MIRTAAFLLLALAASPALAAPPRVVLISIDGWRTDLVKEMPTVRALMKRGSWTLKAETPLPSITVVSHAAMLTGASPEKNGVAGFEPGDDKLAAWRPLKVPTVFSALNARKRSVSAFIQKRKLYGLLPKESVPSLGISNGLDPIVDMACAEIMGVTDAFTFIHLKDIDEAGHARGWMSKAQKAAARRVDTALAELTTCVRQSEEDGGAPVFLIVTGDHGGHGTTHGTDAVTDRLVPWIVVGDNIKHGYEIKATVRLTNTAPTILSILSLCPAELLPDAEVGPVSEIFTFAP